MYIVCVHEGYTILNDIHGSSYDIMIYFIVYIYIYISYVYVNIHVINGDCRFINWRYLSYIGSM